MKRRSPRSDAMSCAGNGTVWKRSVLAVSHWIFRCRMRSLCLWLGLSIVSVHSSCHCPSLVVVLLCSEFRGLSWQGSSVFVCTALHQGCFRTVFPASTPGYLRHAGGNDSGRRVRDLVAETCCSRWLGGGQALFEEVYTSWLRQLWWSSRSVDGSHWTVVIHSALPSVQWPSPPQRRRRHGEYLDDIIVYLILRGLCCYGFWLVGLFLFVVLAKGYWLRVNLG